MSRIGRVYRGWWAAMGLVCLTLPSGMADAEIYSAAQVGYAIPGDLSHVEGTGTNTGTTLSNLSLANNIMYGVKFGYYLDTIKWLGFEAELFNSNPNIKQQTATATTATGSTTVSPPGTSLRVLTLAPINLVLRHQMGKFEPYVGVGMGIFMMNLKDGVTGESSSTSTIGLNTQVGLRNQGK